MLDSDTIDTLRLWAWTLPIVYTCIQPLISFLKCSWLNIATCSLVMWVLMSKSQKPSFSVEALWSWYHSWVHFGCIVPVCDCIQLKNRLFTAGRKTVTVDANIVGFNCFHFITLQQSNPRSSASSWQITDLSLKPDIQQLVLQLAFSAFLPASQ